VGHPLPIGPSRRAGPWPGAAPCCTAKGATRAGELGCGRRATASGAAAASRPSTFPPGAASARRTHPRPDHRCRSRDRSAAAGDGAASQCQRLDAIPKRACRPRLSRSVELGHNAGGLVDRTKLTHRPRDSQASSGRWGRMTTLKHGLLRRMADRGKRAGSTRHCRARCSRAERRNRG